MATVGFLALLPSMIGAARESHRRSQCVDNLERIGEALHAYHEEWDCFPSAYVVGEDDRRMHSWRVLILPYLGEQALYRQYSFNEPWDSPDNLDVARRMPPVFRCPSDRQAGPSDTSYAMTVGPGAFSEGPTSTTSEEIADRMESTVAVVETSGLAIRWTEPRDLDTETMTYVINDTAAIGPISRHPNGADFLFADGKVLWLDDPTVFEGTTPEMLRGLITRAGGEWQED